MPFATDIGCQSTILYLLHFTYRQNPIPMLSYYTVEPHTLELLKELSNQDFLSEARLVGGTALALQYEHRMSVDLSTTRYFRILCVEISWIFHFPRFNEPDLFRRCRKPVHAENVYKCGMGRYKRNHSQRSLTNIFIGELSVSHCFWNALHFSRKRPILPVLINVRKQSKKGY